MSLSLPIGKTDHIQGDPAAALELLEYGDYQCPYCQKAYHIVKRLQLDYGSQLKFIFRNFPLTELHPQARLAALASEAAALQNKYWEMHDYLFEHHDDFGFENLQRIAEILGLNEVQFREDLIEMDADPSSKVEVDAYSGVRSGVSGTPTFFINGEKFNGNWQEGDLSYFLDQKVKTFEA